MKSGQILILVLLIVVVILAIGLSVASRNIINLRTSTQTEQSQRAFTAAEGGIEDVLSRISTIEATHPEITSSAGASITVEQVGQDVTTDVVVKASPVFEDTVVPGNVSQVKLERDSNPQIPAGSQVQIEWAMVNTAQDVSPASIEVIALYGSSPIQQARYYFQGDSSRTNETSSAGFTPSGSCPSPTGVFARCALITTSADPRILRIKPFWETTSVRVSGVGFDLPTQTYNVSSTASTDIGVTRKVEVKRTALPQLPSIFDYALYSETDIIK